MAQNFAIETSQLTRRFPGVTAVDGLSFQVNPGEIFGLVGPDGAGKTTTMRMLAGVLKADSGSAMVAGFDMTRDPEGAKPHLSYMPQRFGLYEDLTVDENIAFYADIFGVPRKQQITRSARLLRAAGMAEFHQRLAGKLSGGMKQKLGLVCALIHTPKVILLDEPTNGVDPVSRREFWGILYSLLDEGVAILTTTAYLDEAERCHRVAFLHQGRLLFCDTPARLKANMPVAVVAVIGPEPRRLRNALQHAEGVRNLVLVGDGVHLFVDDGQKRVSQIQGLLRRENVAVESVELITPTMEDLFVSAVYSGGAGVSDER